MPRVSSWASGPDPRVRETYSTSPSRGLPVRGSRDAPSVRRRIEGHRAQQGVARTEPCQHRVPQAVGLVVEDVLASRGRDDPGFLFELRLELPRPPSRVPGEDTGSPDRAEVDAIALFGEEPDRVEGDDSRLRWILEVRYHDGRLGLDGTAVEQCLAFAHELRERWHGLVHGHVEGSVQDDAHGALLVVMADQHDRPAEVRVEQRRVREQELSGQRSHRTIMQSSVGYAFGIAFAGSQKGSGTTSAWSGPSGDIASTLVPIADRSIGSHAYPMLNRRRGEYAALVRRPTSRPADMTGQKSSNHIASGSPASRTPTSFFRTPSAAIRSSAGPAMTWRSSPSSTNLSSPLISNGLFVTS